jgi:hypothetical protein
MLEYSRRLSNRFSFGLNDTGTSSINDYATADKIGPLTNYASTFVQDVDVARQRITQNSLTATVKYTASPRTAFSVFGSYDFWKYGNIELGNSQGFQVGGRTEHQFNKWLGFNSSYTTYIKKVNDRAATADIHRLQLGGLTLRSRHLDFSFGGGAEMTSYTNKRQFGGSGETSLSWHSRSTLMSLGYNRGFSTAVGTGDIFTTNTMSGSYTRWFSQRVNFRLGAQYAHGSARSGGSLDYLIGSAGLGIALNSHTLLSADYSYLSQELVNVSIGSPRSNRYSGRIGIQFFLPSLGIH